MYSNSSLLPSPMFRAIAFGLPTIDTEDARCNEEATVYECYSRSNRNIEGAADSSRSGNYSKAWDQIVRFTAAAIRVACARWAAGGRTKFSAWCLGEAIRCVFESAVIHLYGIINFSLYRKEHQKAMGQRLQNLEGKLLLCLEQMIKPGTHLYSSSSWI